MLLFRLIVRAFTATTESPESDLVCIEIPPMSKYAEQGKKDDSLSFSLDAKSQSDVTLTEDDTTTANQIGHPDQNIGDLESNDVRRTSLPPSPEPPLVQIEIDDSQIENVAAYSVAREMSLVIVEEAIRVALDAVGSAGDASVISVTPPRDDPHGDNSSGGSGGSGAGGGGGMGGTTDQASNSLPVQEGPTTSSSGNNMSSPSVQQGGTLMDCESQRLNNLMDMSHDALPMSLLSEMSHQDLLKVSKKGQEEEEDLLSFLPDQEKVKSQMMPSSRSEPCVGEASNTASIDDLHILRFNIEGAKQMESTGEQSAILTASDILSMKRLTAFPAGGKGKQVCGRQPPP